MRLKKYITVAGMIVVVGLTGCQKSPDSSIVVNKDMDALIEKAKDAKAGTTDIEELGKEYDTWQTVVENDSLGVTINVDAKIDIPETSKMSIIRVTQKNITQDLLDAVKSELVGETELYDGSVLYQKTRSDIEKEMTELKEMMNTMDVDHPEMSQEDRETYRSEYQLQINELQEKYESASVTYDWEDYSSDGKIHSVEERYQEDTGDELYSWMYSLNPDGDVFYGVNDGEDQSYISLYAHNSPDYGNVIRYRKGTHGYEFVESSIVGATDLGMDEGKNNPGIQKGTEIDVNILNNLYDDGSGTVQAAVFPEDTVNSVTKEQAKEQAEEFLENVGIKGFQYYEGDVYTESVDVRYQCDLEGIPCRTYYILRYMRNIDGAFITFDQNSKHEEGWQDDSYVKRFWPTECIEFRINDQGIVGFDYIAPIEEIETAVEKSSLQSFDEIKCIFEKMAAVTNANEEEAVVINVNRVVLGYTLISEADSYDTGLLVPVWDFQGSITTQYEEEAAVVGGSVLTVNAIDGSVIDRTLGY